MFNVAIDDLAVKPYIPNKSLLQRICCNCLFEAKHTNLSTHHGTLTQSLAHPKVSVGLPKTNKKYVI